MATERLYIVAYDISWRHVFKTMKGYGHWVQLSVFQCRLTARRRAEMAARLDDLIAWPRAVRAPQSDHSYHECAQPFSLLYVALDL